MKTRLPNFFDKRGYALMMTLFFSGIGLLTLGGALRWCASTSRTTDRNNVYYSAAAAAEAATEKILANMSRDFLNNGEAGVYARLPNYRAMIPTPAESSYWSNYAFSDAQGNSDRTYVARTVAWSYVPLQSQYEGLNGMASTYRIISNARVNGLSQPLTAAVKQEIQLASIPIFQFAIFYGMDLEINPGPSMNITGRVHGNANIYTQPQNTLNYLSHVTAAGIIKLGKSPLDPLVRSTSNSRVNFRGESDGGVDTISLPIGTNNSPAAVRSVVEIPPAGEDPASLVGKQRYYNKADLIVILNPNGSATIKSGAWNSFATTFAWTNVSSWISTNDSLKFLNQREGKTVQTTEINVGALKTWSEGQASLRAALGNRDVNSIYVADLRAQQANRQPGIRLVNGAALPNSGLTVATPNPAYIKGHYNANGASVASTNTANTKPASVVADAITVLSTAWNDGNASLSLTSRQAGNTTVNAAFLAGIVESNGTAYSGGVENFPRFLEDWNGNTFTYNGSMVVLYPSQQAVGPWGNSGVYVPPNRNWAFDLNFLDATKLPPGTPQLQAMIRARWAFVAPGTIL